KFFFTFFQRNVLRNEIVIVSWLRIIIRPSVYVRNFSWPVSVDVFHRRCPFKCSRSPWILFCTFSVENAAEEIVKENQLEHTSNQSKNRNQNVHILQIVKQWEVGVGVITSWQTGHSDKVHREKHPVSTHCRYP